MKYRYALNSWLWKWHFIAGLISLPFVFLLAVTGGIYLFKDILAFERVRSSGKLWDLLKLLAFKKN